MATVASTGGARRAAAPRRDLVLVAGLAISLSAFVALVRKLVEAIAFDDGGRQLDASLQELASSRARIQAAADDERRRIERALHDGAQQRLVALRVRLALAADVIRDDPVCGAQVLQELGAAVEETLEVVRALAHDVYPQELIEFGLDAALNDLASREPVRVTVAADCMVRFSPEIEAAVYFCCVEAMRNAVERGGGADRISIALALDDSGLRFEVTDNGDGVAT
jgi:signal transduction histidine kinase